MISAKIIADSVFNGKRITTIQIVMPRFVLAQFNKHRAFSNNAASSRAVPTAKLIEQVRNDYVKPVYWGMNQAGMVAKAELQGRKKDIAKELWWKAAQNASDIAEQMMALNVHKQIANRILEPFAWAHVVVTATEWDNFFTLRLEHDSQPEMQEVARCMKEAMDNSTPVETRYHLPYIHQAEFADQVNAMIREGYMNAEYAELLAYKFMAMVSAARCARVSYLNHDQSEPVLTKDLELANRLRTARHDVCFEHQAQAANTPDEHCRNFQGWQQYRAKVENER